MAIDRGFTLGCPVADRAWVLPAWFDALERQSVRPRTLMFVMPEHGDDETYVELVRGADLLGATLVVLRDAHAPHPRHDVTRFETLSRLRNHLLTHAGDLRVPLVSLDSDVLLGNPRTLELMVTGLRAAPVCAPVTWMHPGGPGSWAVNAGLFTDDDAPGPGMERWARPQSLDTSLVDFPMAVWAASVAVIRSCRYRWHESGEDIGFGLSMREAGYQCLWLTDIHAFHVWDQGSLDETLTLAAISAGCPL